MFVGEYDRSVDGNGRLALPADFRDDLGTKCYVRYHPDGFVSITSIAQFEAGGRPDSKNVCAVGEAPAFGAAHVRRQLIGRRDRQAGSDHARRAVRAATPGSAGAQAVIAGA